MLTACGGKNVLAVCVFAHCTKDSVFVGIITYNQKWSLFQFSWNVLEAELVIFSSSRLVHVDVGMSFLISMFPEENDIKVCPSMCFRFLAFFDGVGFIFPSYRNRNTLQHKPDVVVSRKGTLPCRT